MNFCDVVVLVGYHFSNTNTINTCCFLLTQIAFYVLRDLFLQYPNYAMSDLLQKWQARLPMADVFEKCTTVEWMQERGLVPEQLILEDVGAAEPSNSTTATTATTTSTTASGKVIRLASSDTVLVWKET